MLIVEFSIDELAKKQTPNRLGKWLGVFVLYTLLK
jgi:hypothetical protein